MARLDNVLRASDIAAGTRLGWRGGRVKAVRCEATPTALLEGGAADCAEGDGIGDDDAGGGGGDEGAAAASVAARAVTVPTAVAHRYVRVPKARATDAGAALTAVAAAMRELQPRSSLVFVCGAFAPASTAALEAAAAKASTPAARAAAARSAKKNKSSAKALTAAERAKLRAREKRAARKAAALDDGLGALLGARRDDVGLRAEAAGAGLSARRACAALAALGVDAAPLHVALGLATEKAANREEAGEGGEGGAAGDPTAVAHAALAARFAALASNAAAASADLEVGAASKLGPCLVTFEGSARGLHFEGVDAVFVVKKKSPLPLLWRDYQLDFDLTPLFAYFYFFLVRCIKTKEHLRADTCMPHQCGYMLSSVHVLLLQVGRPSSSSAYLHLAGRVGRLSPDAQGRPGSSSSSTPALPRPGTVVSVCTAGGARELAGWVAQIGGQDFGPLHGTLVDDDKKGDLDEEEEEEEEEEEDDDDDDEEHDKNEKA
jgi:hypothetical protein